MVCLVGENILANGSLSDFWMGGKGVSRVHRYIAVEGWTVFIDFFPILFVLAVGIFHVQSQKIFHCQMGSKCNFEYSIGMDLKAMGVDFASAHDMLHTGKELYNIPSTKEVEKQQCPCEVVTRHSWRKRNRMCLGWDYTFGNWARQMGEFLEILFPKMATWQRGIFYVYMPYILCWGRGKWIGAWQSSLVWEVFCT